MKTMWLHYVLPDGPFAGECRPAVMVRVEDAENEIATLRVFTRGLEDSSGFRDRDVTVTCMRHHLGKPGTWHYADGWEQNNGYLVDGCPRESEFTRGLMETYNKKGDGEK